MNTSICKQLLGVKKHTLNIACKLELGRYLLHIDAVKKCIQNWSRVHRGDACNIIKLVVQKQSNENVWTSSVESKLSRLGFGYIWANISLTKQEIDSQLPNIVQCLMDCTDQDYFSILQSEIKLRTYVKYKHDFKLEPYVTKLNFKNRQELSRLRLSDHKLKVEVGRYTKPKTPLEDRTCTVCPNSVEEEYHFLITCPMYKEEREKLKRDLESNQTTKRQTIHDKELFDLLFSCNENQW